MALGNFLKGLGTVASIAANFIPGGGLIKTAVQLGGKILSNPAVRTVGTIGAVGAGTAGIARVASGGTSMQLPVLGGVGGSLPALATQSQAINQASGGIVPFWRGPGGKLQLPWNDPRIPEMLKAWALDDSALKVYYRAPKGYVIMRDPQGRVYGLPLQIAKQMGYKVAAKPPISATDYKNFKRAAVIEKKLMKIAAPAIRRHQRKHTQAVAAARKKK